MRKSAIPATREPMSTQHSMDRPLERKRFTPARIVLLAIGSLLVVALIQLVLARSDTTRLRVDPTRLTTALVEHGEFRDYYPFDGRIEPKTTVFLDVEEGGRVEEIFVAGGHPIEQGELILRFSNASLQRTAIDTETRLLENLDLLRNTQFNRAQSGLLLRDALLDLDYRILDLEKRHERQSKLIETAGVSRQELETTRDELAYQRSKRELLLQRIEQEEVLSRRQTEQAEESIERLTVSLELLQRIVDSLDVRAPISGFLSSIDAEVGENIRPGQRIGQVDQLDAYKIAVSIDQYYLPRVEVGTPGKFDLDGSAYPVEVTRVYPEVIDDAFSVDVDFLQGGPPRLRRGQRLTVELSFGVSSDALLVSRGGFYQQSSGRWVYLISADGRSARRVPVRFGRQNPRHVEVLEGLRTGDWIVSSSYAAFNDADELVFTQPISLP